MNTNIGIIGLGTIGTLLLDKIILSKLVPKENIFVSNRSREKLTQIIHSGVHVCTANADAAADSDFIFFCVKPQDLKTVFEETKNVITAGKHLISVNGSIRFSQIETFFPENPVTKIIPSVTAEVNASQTLVCHNKNVRESDFEVIRQILLTFGNVIPLPEDELGMGSELVSCMPGFIAALFNEIAKSAQAHTAIPEAQIIQMLLDTMTATGTLMKDKKQTFGDVIRKVATKGGITEEGVTVIENGFPSVINELFVRTLEKRKQTAEAAEKQFL